MANPAKRGYWFALACRIALYTIIAAFLVAAGVVWPMHVWRHWRLYPFGDWGAWLQGVVTPGILLVALLAWLDQQRSAREQARVQHENNLIQARTLLLQFLHHFYGHINYTAACVIVGFRPRGDGIPYGNLECVSSLIDILNSKNVPAKLPGSDIDAVNNVDTMTKNEYYKILAESLKMTLEMVANAQMRQLVDRRIYMLSELVTAYRFGG